MLALFFPFSRWWGAWHFSLGALHDSARVLQALLWQGPCMKALVDIPWALQGLAREPPLRRAKTICDMSGMFDILMALGPRGGLQAAAVHSLVARCSQVGFG